MNNRTKVQIIIFILNLIGSIYATYIGNGWLLLITFTLCISAMLIGMNLDLNNKKVSKWFDKTNFFNKKF